VWDDVPGARRDDDPDPVTDAYREDGRLHHEHLPVDVPVDTCSRTEEVDGDDWAVRRRLVVADPAQPQALLAQHQQTVPVRNPPR
jgi:hypothetical protein